MIVKYLIVNTSLLPITSQIHCPFKAQNNVIQIKILHRKVCECFNIIKGLNTRVNTKYKHKIQVTIGIITKLSMYAILTNYQSPLNQTHHKSDWVKLYILVFIKQVLFYDDCFRFSRQTRRLCFEVFPRCLLQVQMLNQTG